MATSGASGGGGAAVHDKFYNFPPFFTLQPTPSSRTRQLEMWTKLVKSHCEASRQLVNNLRASTYWVFLNHGDLVMNAGARSTCYNMFVLTRSEPLYSNEDIKRSLSEDFVTELFNYMIEHDHAFPHVPASPTPSSPHRKKPSGPSVDSIVVLFFPKDKWYEKLYDYAKRNGLVNGGIATLFEILNDSAFEGMDEIAGETLLRGMQHDTRKCEVIHGSAGGVEGVKFF